MPIIITNETPEVQDPYARTYSIRIDDKPPVAHFKHVKANGLAELMKRAADAVAAYHNEKG